MSDQAESEGIELNTHVSAKVDSLTDISGIAGSPFFIARLSDDADSVLGVLGRRLIIEAEGSPIFDHQITFTDFAWMIKSLVSTFSEDVELARRLPTFRLIAKEGLRARMAEDLRTSANRLNEAADIISQFQFRESMTAQVDPSASAPEPAAQS